MFCFCCSFLFIYLFVLEQCILLASGPNFTLEIVFDVLQLLNASIVSLFCILVQIYFIGNLFQNAC